MSILSSWVLCPPQYYRVEYVINPWMEGQIGQVRQGVAQRQWEKLFSIISKFASVRLIPPEPGVPDMTFVANAGLVNGSIFIPSRFQYPQRQPEESYFLQWFNQSGYKVIPLDEGVTFEGEGDALFQPDESLLWCGHGFRTSIHAPELLCKILNMEVIPLKLINPEFYHLDTCFLPLANRHVIFYAAAFDQPSLEKIYQYFPETNRVEITKEDACNFACNAIVIDDVFICNKVSDDLKNKLEAWGYQIIQMPLNQFMLAGGSAKCLALCLAHQVKPVEHKMNCTQQPAVNVKQLC